MTKPWVGIQYWETPVFMHWPVSYDALRPLVPEPFQIDTFHGQAWIGIVPFKAGKTSLRWGAGLFSLEPFWQLNVRTYIRFYEEPAVYFLTVYTNSKLSILGANSLLSLPYKHANFDASTIDNNIFCYMKRANGHQDARFRMNVQPTTEPYLPKKHTLEHWLTERYHFYAIKGRHIVKASISHTPWNLQDADARLMMAHDNLTDLIPENTPPLVHIGTSQKTFLYPFEVKGKYLQ